MVANPVDENATGPGWDEVWERIKATTGIKTQRGLAAELGVSDASVADAKKRGLFPLGWAYRLSLKLEISLDLILLGRGELKGVRTEPPRDRKPIYIDSAVELVEKALEASGRRINSEQKAALVSIIRDELKRKTDNLVNALTS